MALRAHRRNVVVWSSSGGTASGHGPWRRTRPARAKRVRRCARAGLLLTVIGLVRLAGAVRPRWRPLLAGSVLTVAGIVLRSTMWGVAFIPGLLLLLSAPLAAAGPGADLKRHSALERELAAYSTEADRSDLEAILSQYPDSDTSELRDILASQAAAARNTRIPGAGQR